MNASSVLARIVLTALVLAVGFGLPPFEKDAVGPKEVRSASPSGSEVQEERTPLRGPSAFADIADRKERSIALFLEASKVLLHPRCANCHPPDDTPRQGDRHEFHDPPVVRGADDTGIPGMRCYGCHQATNLELARVPGAPRWHLAPIEMAWLGRTPAEIAAQLRDRSRNGDRSLEEIQHHIAHDHLVAWGWNPGSGREPAPGTQALVGELIQAWIDTGAEIPPAKEGR